MKFIFIEEIIKYYQARCQLQYIFYIEIYYNINERIKKKNSYLFVKNV